MVSGVRRCGKSTLFEIYIYYLFNHGIDKKQLIFINFEDLSYNHLRDCMTLFSFIMERIQPDKTNYIFLDEIQHVSQFERVVDFVAMNENGIEYFQVAATVRDEKILNRELKPLLKINDNYPKYLLTLDEDPEGDYQGVKRINVLDYLLR